MYINKISLSVVVLIVSCIISCSVSSDRFDSDENFSNYVFIHDCNRDDDEQFETDLASSAFTPWPKMIVRCPPYWWFFGN
jgi:hypothetical protein